jgi:L-fuculose-phosphate aldolase
MEANLPADVILPGMQKTEEEHRLDICVAGRWLFERGFAPATDGNLSVRLDANRVLASPTGMRKGTMTPEDMVIVDLEGRKLSGERCVSSEIGMHVLIYRMRPDVQAVCHAHPSLATGFAAAGVSLDRAILCEQVVALGSVPVAPYGTPGTPELAATIEPFTQAHDAILLANHGVVTYGPDLLTAFFRMELTEHLARVSLVTKLLGKESLLSEDDVETLLAARARYGVQTAADTDLGRPISAESNSETERVTLTRAELEALIDEAVQKERSRRVF